MPRFDLIERVACSAIVTSATRAHDGKTLLELPVGDEMGCHLVLDARPELIRVQQGERGSLPLWPAAYHQAPFVVTAAEVRAHGIRMIGQAGFEIVAMDGKEVALDLLPVEQ